ncbi:autotransporter domain-containing protein [Selenomonas ruminantium]|uniref:autotransporter outer membrane beta-barrel domain-containing protein n=1 Tax=Selenomonas ruminantium TaxID=971 RepID=UPI0026F24E23|nr:autotransporter outer membrane beta-barrel domain-containing protein [Selenomonas ruminantium]
MRNKRNCILTAAVLSSLAMPLSYAAAEEPAYPYLETVESTYNGKTFAKLLFMDQGYGIGYGEKPDDPGWLVNKATYKLSDRLIDATVTSTDYWKNILAPGARNTTPWQIFVTTFEEVNADAVSQSLDTPGGIITKDFFQNHLSYVKDQLQEGKVFTPVTYTSHDALPEGKYAYSVIRIGKYVGASRNNVENGWWIDADTVLPTNEQAADFVGTFRHELGHALGISCVGDGEPKPGKPNENNFFIDKKITDKLSWTLHLRDQNDTPAKAGMYFADSNDPKDPNKEYFVVDRKITTDGKGYAYFYGDHVTEALGGATFFGRSALPVNGWELSGNILIFDGSHLQTAGMMSHRPYSNYTSFLEVELAVMQDLGYPIDRKAFYGRSIYGNDGTIVNNQGYFAHNADGTDYLANTYSLVPLGVGLHIYGSDNKVTQNADIMTKGTGAVGVRVDGTGNTLIVPEKTEIHADGRRGNGLLIAYGRNHTIEQAGTVTAGGEGGTGVRFDFGSSSNGARDEYRGSYIRYKRTVDETNGNIAAAENLALKEMTANYYNANNEELEGALVNDYNLSGALIGADNAIYIARNAFVKNININKGARIQGDITSNWKQFGEDECEGAYDDPGTSHSAGLRIQYNKKYGNDGYEYDDYILDLVTNLNFNTDMTYSGNITGEDNMKMKVNAGTLTYEGAANVVNVQVAKDAALLGGTYTVNDMSDRQNADFAADTTTGQFINHGTIGASAADRNMTINGTLVSDGRLQAYGSGENGRIIVKGAAKLDGSTVTAREMMPGESKTVLTAQSISGTIANADTAVPVSGMISAKGKITDNNTLSVEMTAANNLGSTDETVNNACNTVINMYDSMGAEKFQQGEWRKLFYMEPEAAARSLTDISSSNAVQGMSMAQTSTVTSHILSARLAEAYAMKNMAVHVPVAKLADDQQSTADEGLKLQAKVDQPVDNDIWFKTAKNWGELKGGANYHGTTFALGYDKAAGKNWRVGGFVSYGRSSFAAGSAGSKVQDTRFGLYGGCKSGPHEGYVYLSHGWLKNDLSRGISGFGTAKADYNSHILELGGEYKYDLQANKAAAWHVSPYVNMQLSRLWQDGYTESGVGALGQSVNSAGNTYFATGLGMEFKRYLNKGSYAMRLGLKHAFSGANPRVTFGLAGGGASVFEMRGQQDKTHMVMSINGETEFSPGWTVSGDAVLERGSNDRDIMCAVTLRRMW